MKIWCLDYRDKVYTDAAMRDVTRYRGLKLFDGIKLAGQFPPDAIIEVRSKRIPTDFFCAGIFWIVSSKLRAILDAHAVQAEYLPVSVVRKNGDRIYGEWFCFNPLLVVDWFDRTNAQFVAEQGFATNIETVAVKEGVFDEIGLAVADRTIPLLVGVTDTLASIVIANGCSGVEFRDPQDWQNPVNPVTYGWKSRPT